MCTQKADDAGRVHQMGCFSHWADLKSHVYRADSRQNDSGGAHRKVLSLGTTPRVVGERLVESNAVNESSMKRRDSRKGSSLTAPRSQGRHSSGRLLRSCKRHQEVVSDLSTAPAPRFLRSERHAVEAHLVHWAANVTKGPYEPADRESAESERRWTIAGLVPDCADANMIE